MKQKRHSTEGIIRILRQADGDDTVDSICREHNISQATLHRWRRKYGDMDMADAKRLKTLEKENAGRSPAQKKQAVAYGVGRAPIIGLNRWDT